MRNSESDFMESLLGTLNDIEDGTADPVAAQQNYDETRKLLEGLNEVGLAYGNLLNPEDAPQAPRGNMNNHNELYEYEDDWRAGENLANHYAQIPGEYVFEEPDTSYYNPNPQPISAPQYSQPKTNWSLVEGTLEGTKNTKVYSVKSNHSGQILMDGMLMFEAAQTIVNLLNEGRNFSDIKVLGIISSSIQYSAVVMEALKSVKKRHAVLKESKYDVAQELDTIIAQKKQEAQKLKERVITFLVDEGYITK